MKKSLLSLVAILALVGLSPASAADYSFTVENKSGALITGVLVSETGKTYAPFDIGSGIKNGETAKLVWDKSTESQECKQWVKAVFAGGEESEPAKFDFCEEKLEIVFE